MTLSRDYIKNNFLTEDRKQAKEQLKCYLYNRNLSKQAVKTGRIDRALAYHENESLSLNALAELKDKSDRTKAEFIKRQLVKAYD